MFRILVINPGSTSTKIAVYNDIEKVFDKTIRHDNNILSKFKKIIKQKEYRYNMISNILKENNLSFNDFDAIAARGGIIKAISSGTYLIDEDVVNDLRNMQCANLHASCLAGLIAFDLSKKYNIPSYMVDPVVVDEYCQEAKITGIPNISRKSIFHALNHKAIARKCANDLNKKYEDTNLIIAHMGGGISVAAHQKGQVIDANNAIDGEGPMSVERCGFIAIKEIIDLIKNNVSLSEIEAYCSKNGGMIAYLNTNDLTKVEKMIDNNDKNALLFYNGLVYQIAKEIGAMSCVLKGDIDAIVLTGGLSYSKRFTDLISERVSFISKVMIYPGENELEALAFGVLRVLKNIEKAKKYKEEIRL